MKSQCFLILLFVTLTSLTSCGHGTRLSKPQTETMTELKFGDYVGFYLAYGLGRVKLFARTSFMFRSTAQDRKTYRQAVKRLSIHRTPVPSFQFEERALVFLEGLAAPIRFDLQEMDTGVFLINQRRFPLTRVLSYGEAKSWLETRAPELAKGMGKHLPFYSFIVMGISEIYGDKDRLVSLVDWFSGLYGMDMHISAGDFRKNFKESIIMSHLVVECRNKRVSQIYKKKYYFDDNEFRPSVTLAYKNGRPHTLFREKTQCLTKLSPTGKILESKKECRPEGTNIFLVRPFYNFPRFAEKCCAQQSCQQKLEKRMQEVQHKLRQVYQNAKKDRLEFMRKRGLQESEEASKR